jgi:predicted TIM-barrel fold metal-dependent hydrolase
MLIIDSHCHAGKGDGLTGPWDTNAPLNNYLKWADEYRITRTVLFAVFQSDYAIANYNVARIVISDPSRYYGFAFVHAIRDAGRIFYLIKTAVQQYGFCGIKVHRYDARITREICETARSFSLPVLYDIMGEVSQVYLLAKEYPDVNFIIPHLGSFSDDWKAQQSFIDPLSFYPNIYTDTAGVRRFDLLKEAVDRAGADKIIFGSDGPWLHPGVELEKIYALRACENDLKQMLSGNFLRLIQNIKFAQNQPEPTGNSLQNTYKVKTRTMENRDPWLFRQS